jgi:hypothetical protein
MMRYQYLADRGIIAAIAAMLRSVTKKHTWHGARTKLVRGGAGDVTVTKTTENLKCVIEWRPTMKMPIRYEGANGFAGVSIEEICRSG